MDLTILLDSIRQKRERLEAIQREMAEIQAELKQIESATRGTTQRVLVRGSANRNSNVRRNRPIQAGSSVDRAIKVLKSIGKPATADEIVSRINRDGGPIVHKTTLVSNLSRYVKGGDTFTRPAPNTYGLAEHQRQVAAVQAAIPVAPLEQAARVATSPKSTLDFLIEASKAFERK
ncbi:MAG TPA: hypothetical protein VN700_04765 [Vicinamibacterales bacterium]|nr:hypothetical protein [Vicinamibacterales bacterium]